MRLLTIFLILYLLQVTAGVAPCDPSLIKEGSDPTAEFEFNNGMLKCKDSKEIVIEEHRLRYDDLKCDVSKNLWVHGLSPLTPETKADEELKFKCKAKACDISYIKGVNTSKIEYIDGKLKCKDDKYIIIKADRDRNYDELSCDVNDGWKNGDNKINIESTINIVIKCKGRACDKSYIKGVQPGKDAKYVNESNTKWVLTCTNPQQTFELIRRGPVKLSPQLTCYKDREKWYFKNEEDEYNFFGKYAQEEIKVKCVTKACHKLLINYDEEKVKTYSADEKKLECKESFEFVSIETDERWVRINSYSQGKRTLKAQSKVLTCDPFGTWKSDDGEPTEISATEEIKIVKCEVQACHKNLINGTADKSEQNVLKCYNNKVLQIHGDSNFFKTLKCDDSKWFDPTDQKKVQVKAATEKFTIDCIPEPCTYQATGIVYDSATRTLSCHPGEIELGGKSHKSLTCDGRTGWSENGGSVVAPAEPKLVVNCKHFCTTTADVDYKMSSDGSYSVKCKEFAVMLYDGSGAKKEVKDVICSKNNGWKADNFNGKSSDSKFEQLECKKACDKQQKPKDPSDPDSTNDAKWEDGLTDLAKKISKGPRNVQFECNNLESPPKYVITMKGKLMDSLNCDAGGYTDTKGTRIGSALDNVKIACVKICVTPADVEYKISDDGSYAVTCKGIAIMEYDDSRGKKEVKDMRCSVDGWKRDGVNIGKSSDRPLQQLSCKRACYKHQKPNPSDPGKWDDGLTNLAEEISKGPGKVQFECKNKKFGQKNSVIKLNSKFVNSHLKCDFDGYTDMHGTKLADAFTTVNIECVDSCIRPSNINGECNTNDKTAELECYNSIFYVSHRNEDPYQLKCDPEKNLQIIYDADAKKFLENKPIMCYERGQFYFNGDSNPGKTYRYDSLLCVRKRCNTCEKLRNRGAGTGVDNYTPGTADKCATDKCPNNYWMIKREGYRSDEEEYVGEVTCSSKNGEWQINADSDHPTTITEGYCIASLSKKCTVDAKLDTKCESVESVYSWEEPEYQKRCDEDKLRLNDNDDIDCDYGLRKMFYKKKGEEYFEEGAKRIKCDKTRGVWIVKKYGENDELREGDSVICAEENPLPKHRYGGKHDSYAEKATGEQGDYSAVIGFLILGVILIVIIVIAIVANRKMKRKPKGKPAQISNTETNKNPETPVGGVNKNSKGISNEANSVHSEPTVVTPAV